MNPFPRTLILGHRGAPRAARENTLASLRLAVEQGADGVELDVQRTGDGVPVVIHDETLDRTEQGRGSVAERRWKELRGAGAGEGERVPSLREAAQWAAEAGIWLNVEIKARAVEEETLEVLRSAGIVERTVISSFHPEVVGRVGALAPEARRFLLTKTWDAEAQRALAACGAQGVCLHVDAATAPVLDTLAHDALPVIVWTVDDPARMRELLRAGVAALITNLPDLGARVRAEVLGA